MTDPLLHLCCHHQGEIRGVALRERLLRAGQPAWRRRALVRSGTALILLGGWLREQGISLEAPRRR
jgi:hypothetical protein